METTCFVTTSVPYVNARPHVGFALELVQADAVSRYHRLLGHEVRFQTGTDENALKNVIAARSQGVSPKELVDANARLFRELCSVLHASPDDFLRTTEPRHVSAVHRFWEALQPEDVYRAKYTGLYCVGCEDFLSERELVDGHCPDHGASPSEVAEENYFFRLSAYQCQIDELLTTDRLKVIPEFRKREVLSFVRDGLRDISISRAADRAPGWGIVVPGDASQTVYVWVDALVNYISGLVGYGSGENWRCHWNDGALKVHVIGKNVWKFHAVYWPALLLSAGLPLPNHIVVHGFLTEEGRKISKSGLSTVAPSACVEECGVDAVRYYLLRGSSPFADSDFSLERLKLLYDADLANNLGNLVNRLTTLCPKAGLADCSLEAAPEAPPSYHDHMRSYAFDRGLAELWKQLDAINREIDQVEPWRLITDGALDHARAHLGRWLQEVHRVGFWLSPFVPRAAAAVVAAVERRPLAAAGSLFPRLS
jgi:methionyl-tRNA synthetase